MTWQKHLIWHHPLSNCKSLLQDLQQECPDLNYKTFKADEGHKQMSVTKWGKTNPTQRQHFVVNIVDMVWYYDTRIKLCFYSQKQDNAK